MRRSIWRAALIPAAANLIGQVGWAICPYHADAPTIGFVIRTSFLFTAAFGFLFIPAERALARKPAFLLGAVVCLAGVGVIVLGAAPAQQQQPATSPAAAMTAAAPSAQQQAQTTPYGAPSFSAPPCAGGCTRCAFAGIWPATRCGWRSA